MEVRQHFDTMGMTGIRQEEFTNVFMPSGELISTPRRSAEITLSAKDTFAKGKLGISRFVANARSAFAPAYA